MDFRKPNRLKHFDYSQPGSYYVTVVTAKRRYLFGQISQGIVALSDAGRIAHAEWIAGAQIRERVVLDEFVIMPDHFHAVVTLPTSALCQEPTQSLSLGTIVGDFKRRCTKRIRQLRRDPDATVWQRGYYDHVVRNTRDRERIRRYIRNNPVAWSRDRGNRRR